MEQKSWYVYLLCDPDTEEPFYVGKGKGNRMHLHGVDSDDRNIEKLQTIREIEKRGKQVLKKKVAEFTNEEDAFIYEWSMINLYHGQITNIRHNGTRAPKIKRIKVKIRVCEGQQRPEIGDRVVVVEEQGTVCRKIVRTGTIYYHFGDIPNSPFLDYMVELSQDIVNSNEVNHERTRNP